MPKGFLNACRLPSVEMNKWKVKINAVWTCAAMCDGTTTSTLDHSAATPRAVILVRGIKGKFGWHAATLWELIHTTYTKWLYHERMVGSFGVINVVFSYLWHWMQPFMMAVKKGNL